MNDIDNEQTENLVSDPWGPWQSANSAYKIKYRTRRGDDLGDGNFAWMVEINYNDLGSIEYDYEIDFRKGDGISDKIEGHTTSGASEGLSAAKIIKVIALNVTRS